MVDFRKAPPPGIPRDPSDLAGALGQSGGGTWGATVAPATKAALPAGADPDTAIAQYFAPNPGGNIIYYRVD